MSEGFTVDEDNLEQLGHRLQMLAGFLDGGNYVGTGGHDPTADVGDQAEDIESELGGAPQRPHRYSSDQADPGNIPQPAFLDFLGNWEDSRADLAADIRTLGSMLQAAGHGYRYEDEDIAFAVEAMQAPPATPVRGDPSHLTG